MDPHPTSNTSFAFNPSIPFANEFKIRPKIGKNFALDGRKLGRHWEVNNYIESIQVMLFLFPGLVIAWNRVDAIQGEQIATAVKYSRHFPESELCSKHT